MRRFLSILFMACCVCPLLAENEEGFVPLFDGKSLTGWRGDTKGYEAVEGAIVCQKGKGGNLYTEKEYGDFELRFEFKLTAGANNGLGIRAPIGGDAAYQGMELQVLDDTSPQYAKLQDYQYHGSIYGVVAAKRGHLKPVGEWNQQTVIAKGKQIKIILNGETIVDADIEKASTPKTVDGKEHPGLWSWSARRISQSATERIEITLAQLVLQKC
jgi:Domain of Unknown Function (DUF1080)